MHMLDWNTYQQQLVAGVGGFGKLNPDIVKGYTTLTLQLSFFEVGTLSGGLVSSAPE